jgi:hypothetical protein
LAQDEAPPLITYGQALEGAITPEDYRDLYTFSGRAGEIIRLRAASLDGDLDPLLLLLDANGRALAWDDDGGGDLAAEIDSLRLEQSGEYFILVTRFGHQQGGSTGPYRLSLDRLGANLPAGSILRYGDQIIGDIRPENPQLVYVFEGQRGEVVNLQMQRTSGNLDALLDLANAQGQVLVSGDDDPRNLGSLNAGILNFTLPADGYYIIVATRYGRETGDTQGSFLLSLESIPSTDRGLSPGNAVLIDYGDTLEGSLNDEQSERFFVFEGRRAEVITLDMIRAGGNLNPYLILLDANLSPLLQAGGEFPFEQASIPAFSLPADGLYYLMAGREDFAQGETRGDFRLSLSGRPGIVGTAYVEIFSQTPVLGYLSDTLPYENFVFLAQAGDSLTLRLNASSGNLDPLLTLFDPSGKQIYFDDNSGDGPNALILSYRIREGGVYRAEAARAGRESGETEGAYTLRLEIR